MIKSMNYFKEHIICYTQSGVPITYSEGGYKSFDLKTSNLINRILLFCGGCLNLKTNANRYKISKYKFAECDKTINAVDKAINLLELVYNPEIKGIMLFGESDKEGIDEIRAILINALEEIKVLLSNGYSCVWE